MDKEKLTGKLITLPLDIMHSIADEIMISSFNYHAHLLIN